MFCLLKRTIRILPTLAVAVGLLAACGGPEPTPIVVVVTRADTPVPEAQTATPTTPPPEVVPSDTPVPTVAPSDTPLPPPTAGASADTIFVPYEHPSGTFSLRIPIEAEYEETEDGFVFAYGDSLVLVLFAVPGAPLDSEAIDAVIPVILDEALLAEDLITSYDNLVVEHNEAGNGAVASMTMTSNQIGDGEGALVLWQVEHVLYIMILLTHDYAAVESVWEAALDSVDVTPSAVAAPTVTLAPPPTAVPPTATKRPKPTSTPTSAPPPTSPPASSQGCYLFENYIDAELTVTFTAQDRQWSDSFTIPANGTKEYCLDPGRYTYTIDAPPPWSSLNGEITVRAGDRFRWPIRGG